MCARGTGGKACLYRKTCARGRGGRNRKNNASRKSQQIGTGCGIQNHGAHARPRFTAGESTRIVLRGHKKTATRTLQAAQTNAHAHAGAQVRMLKSIREFDDVGPSIVMVRPAPPPFHAWSCQCSHSGKRIQPTCLRTLVTSGCAKVASARSRAPVSCARSVIKTHETHTQLLPPSVTDASWRGAPPTLSRGHFAHSRPYEAALEPRYAHRGCKRTVERAARGAAASGANCALRSEL